MDTEKDCTQYGGEVDHTWPTQQCGFNDAGLGCACSELEMIYVFSADRVGYLLTDTLQYMENRVFCKANIYQYMKYSVPEAGGITSAKQSIPRDYGVGLIDDCAVLTAGPGVQQSPRWSKFRVDIRISTPPDI